MIESAPPTVKHLYLFDDLTYHIDRLGDPAVVKQVKREVWSSILTMLDCFDYGVQDVNLVNWDHAQSQLSWTLFDANATYDLIVAQGCNGDYALQSLEEHFLRETGRELSRRRANVRVAHFLEDREDPFHSGFTIGVSSGRPLSEQCREAAALVQGDGFTESSPLRVAVFDDCIQTGEGTRAVLNELREAFGDAVVEYSTIGFIACEATQNRFRSEGLRPIQGVLLRGETYPVAWEWDIYFLKDLFLDNAIRFTDGSETSYLQVQGDWLNHLFGAKAGSAKQAIADIRRSLVTAGLYDQLLDM